MVRTAGFYDVGAFGQGIDGVGGGSGVWWAFPATSFDGNSALHGRISAWVVLSGIAVIHCGWFGCEVLPSRRLQLFGDIGLWSPCEHGCEHVG